MQFQNPLFLLLLLLLIVIVLQKRSSGGVRFASIETLRQIPRSPRVYLHLLIGSCRYVAIGLMVIALARPIKPNAIELTEGLNIILVLDVSGSMAAEDFKPKNRLDSAKFVLRSFLANRKNDRIGLVIFSGESLTLCPLTTDYKIVSELIKRAEIGAITDGTAIGSAIMTAINRLRKAEGNSVVILLTDGENNAGEIDPITSAEVAKTFGVPIYTIGVGTKEGALVPYIDPIFGKRYRPIRVSIDEPTLKKIAEITDAQYFRAIDTDRLKKIYNEIDKIERSKITTVKKNKELAIYFMLPAAIFIMLEFILHSTILRKIP